MAYNFLRHIQTLSKSHDIAKNTQVLSLKQVYDTCPIVTVDAVESGVGSDGRKYYLCRIKNSGASFYADREFAGVITLWLNDLRTIDTLNKELEDSGGVIVKIEECVSDTGNTYYKTSQSV